LFPVVLAIRPGLSHVFWKPKQVVFSLSVVLSENSCFTTRLAGRAKSAIIRNAHNVFIGGEMHKRMTITLDEPVYEGLYRMVGQRRMSQFIEDLLRPHVVDTSLDDEYRAMAADAVREAEALEWSNALIGDVADDAR
jgi:hypothetical protein